MQQREGEGEGVARPPAVRCQRSAHRSTAVIASITNLFIRMNGRVYISAFATFYPLRGSCFFFFFFSIRTCSEHTRKPRPFQRPLRLQAPSTTPPNFPSEEKRRRGANDLACEISLDSGTLSADRECSVTSGSLFSDWRFLLSAEELRRIVTSVERILPRWRENTLGDEKNFEISPG